MPTTMASLPMNLADVDCPGVEGCIRSPRIRKTSS